MKKRALRFYSILLFLALTFPATLRSQDGVLGVMTVGSQPVAAAINPRTNQAFVLSKGSQEVFVIDLRSRTVTSKYLVGGVPEGIAANPRTNYVVVAHQYDMELFQVNLDKNSIEKRLYVGRYLSEAAANPETGQIVVGNPSSNGIITVYDPVLNSIVSTLSVGAGPLSLAVYSKRNLALVCEYNSDTVSLVDLKLNRVIRTIPVAKGPSGIAVHPGTGVAVVTNRLSDSVTFLDIEALFAGIKGRGVGIRD